MESGCGLRNTQSVGAVVGRPGQAVPGDHFSIGSLSRRIEEWNLRYFCRVVLENGEDTTAASSKLDSASAIWNEPMTTPNIEWGEWLQCESTDSEEYRLASYLAVMSLSW
jgi:hypothetical protein